MRGCFWVALILLSIPMSLLAACLTLAGSGTEKGLGLMIVVALVAAGVSLASSDKKSAEKSAKFDALSPEAKAVLKKAAKKDAESLFLAGRMFECGEHGVRPDREEALNWYELAKERGHAEAKIRFNEILSRTRMI